MNLLDIRWKHTIRARARELGLQPDQIVESHLVDYETPGSAVRDCHKELMDQLEPAIRAYHEHQETLGMAKKQFNIHKACPWPRKRGVAAAVATPSVIS